MTIRRLVVAAVLAVLVAIGATGCHFGVTAHAGPGSAAPPPPGHQLTR